MFGVRIQSSRWDFGLSFPMSIFGLGLPIAFTGPDVVLTQRIDTTITNALNKMTFTPTLTLPP